MADVKISGLPASTVPLAGTEVLPIVQGGDTKQVSVANLTAGRAIAATSITTDTYKAASSSGGALQNSSGTPQLQWGAGGGNNLSVDVAININPANAAVAISPTGTGTLTINPATASTMNNVAIGGTTPLAGAFTTATANSFIPTSATVPTNGMYLPAANTVAFATNSTAAMRVNSTQDVLINSTAIVLTSKFSLSFDGVARNGFGMNDTTGTAASVGYQNFLRNGTGVGSISYSSGSGLVSYNVTSDYRLKENVIDLPNGLSTVLKLKPRQFDWKNTGNTTTGFIAHELQAILPHAVTGEKDAVDNEQNPVYQQMDSSFLIATLVKSIQELNAKFDDYVASHP